MGMRAQKLLVAVYVALYVALHVALHVALRFSLRVAMFVAVSSTMSFTMFSTVFFTASFTRRAVAQTVPVGSAPLPKEFAHLTPEEVARIVRMSPLSPLPGDPSNRFADDEAAAMLGHALFFETRLSPKGVSCATCHDPAKYFTDGEPLAKGVGVARRNAPTVVDAARRRWVGWDGKFDSLWSQALAPIEHPDEMGSDRRTLLRVIRDTPEHRARFERAFGPYPTELIPLGDALDPLDLASAPTAEQLRVIDQTTAHALKALGAYQRRVLSVATPLDRFVAALKSEPAGDLDALHAEARRGLAMFVSRAGCWQCHRGPSFTDEEFHALGLAGANGRVPDDPAREAAVTFLKQNPFNVAGEFSDARDTAKAAMVRGLKEGGEQFGQFRTPPLRGVAFTAPYMHDGRFATLSDVVRFYDTLEGASPVGHHGEMVLEPLGLTDLERADLVAFLESLSPDLTILRDSLWWRDPRGSSDRNQAPQGTSATNPAPTSKELPQ